MLVTSSSVARRSSWPRRFTPQQRAEIVDAWDALPRGTKAEFAAQLAIAPKQLARYVSRWRPRPTGVRSPLTADERSRMVARYAGLPARSDRVAIVAAEFDVARSSVRNLVSRARRRQAKCPCGCGTPLPVGQHYGSRACAARVRRRETKTPKGSWLSDWVNAGIEEAGSEAAFERRLGLTRGMAYRWRRGAMMSETTYRNLVENGYLAAFAPEQSDRFVCPDEKRPGHRGRTPKQSQKRDL